MTIADDFFNISTQLEDHHSVFYAMWKFGYPVITEKIDTAAISFSEDGTALEFLINPTYWDSMSNYDRLFTICHECLHVILNHGKRSCGDISTKDNLAMDISVNHILIRSFGFERDKLSDWKDLCWVDTVFKKDKKIDLDGNYEYYLSKLKDENINKNVTSFDDHSFLKGMDDKYPRYLDSIKDFIPEDAKETFRQAVDSQIEPLDSFGTWISVKVEPVKKKKKWESVIKDWSKAILKYKNDSHYQWTHINRRFVNVQDDFILPTESVIEREEPDKIIVFFFLDSSGSCINYKDRFFKAALSLPKDRFIVRGFSFDTKVKEVDLKSQRIYGGGGTSFGILETKIQSLISEKKEKYPHAVFVITDGYGSKIQPQHPNRWHWFLTSGSIKSFIPDKSYCYSLSSFE